MASYGSGRKKQVSARIYHRPTHSRYSLSTDRFGGCVFQRQRPSADSHRRSSAVSTGYSYCIWTYQTPPTQERQGQTQVSQAQTIAGFSGGCCKEDPRRQRPSVESIEQSSVWQKERNRKAYSKAGHWSQDQYFSYGTTQWYDKRPTSSFDKTYSQRLSSGRDAAVFDMVVAGFVQLDKSALFSAGRNTCDGIVPDEQGLDCFEIYFVSGSCQQLSTSRLGRAA